MWKTIPKITINGWYRPSNMGWFIIVLTTLMSNDIMILMRFWILDRCLMEFDYVFEHFFLNVIFGISIKHCYICEETQLHFAWILGIRSSLSKSLH